MRKIKLLSVRYGTYTHIQSLYNLITRIHSLWLGEVQVS